MPDGILGGIAGGATVAITIKAVDNFSGIFTKAGLSIKNIGKIAIAGALAIAAAIAGIGISAVKIAADFETAFTGVRKTVELTEEQFEELENRFKTLTTEIPLTFEELAGIGEIAGQLGVEGVDNIAKFTKTIADISVTTNLTAEQAATDFARFANIMNMPIDQVDRLGSVVVDLGNNLATTEAEIVSMGMRIAGAGAALDMTEGEVMAWAGALSSMGVRAEMGGTAISKFMINMSSMVATNSPELEKFAKVAGMTSAEFIQAFQEDASKALQTFFVGLGNVKEQGGDVLLTLEDLGITEVRLRDTVLRLAAGGDTLTDSLNIQVTAWEENIALVEEAEKRYETFASQVQILKNESRLLFEELGKELIPILLDLFKVIKSDVLPAMKPLIPVFAEFIGTVLKGAVVVIPKMIEAIKEIISFLKPLIEIIGRRLKMAFEFVRAVIGDSGPVLMEFIKKIGEIARIFLTALVPILRAVLPILIQLGTIIADSLLGILETFAKVLDENKDVIIMLVQRVGEFIGQVLSRLVPVLKELIPVVIEVGLQLAEVAMDILEALLPAVAELIPTIMELLKDVIIPLLPPLTDLIKNVVGLAVAMFYELRPAIDFVVGAIKAFVDPLIFIINLVSEFIDLVTTPITSVLSGVFGGLFGGSNRSIPGYQKGGVVPHTGLAMVHKGETVIPAGRAAGVTIYIENINGLSGRDLADSLQEELNKKI